MLSLKSNARKFIEDLINDRTAMIFIRNGTVVNKIDKVARTKDLRDEERATVLLKI